MGLVLGIDAYRKSLPSVAVDDPGSWGTPISDGSLAIQLTYRLPWAEVDELEPTSVRCSTRLPVLGDSDTES
jgi:hypothetical protein